MALHAIMIALRHSPLAVSPNTGKCTKTNQLYLYIERDEMIDAIIDACRICYLTKIDLKACYYIFVIYGLMEISRHMVRLCRH